MKEALNIKELLDFAYNKHKSKNAISIDKGYVKDINYFNYRFDIYSLSRAIKTKIQDNKVAIISENRYEFLVTFFANIILKNTIVIIDDNMSQKMMANVIKKYNIKTIFFSNKNENKILEIYKDNFKKKKLNLINFDSKSKFPIIEFEKLINIGRYIENYSIDNIPDTDEKIKNIIIANLEETRAYSQQEFLKSAYIIGKNIKLRKRKSVQAEISSNTFFKIVIKSILPLLYGLNIQFTDICKNIKYNIEILEERNNRIVITYRNNKYSAEHTNSDTYVIKMNNSLLSKKNTTQSTNFILIKSKKAEKIRKIRKELECSSKLTNSAK